MNSKESIDPYEWEMGEYYIRSYSSPRGYVIAMKNLWLMLKDLREGKYIEYIHRQEGESFVVNPNALVPILKELGRETELAKLWLISKGAQEMMRRMESTQSTLIELAWNLFIAADPQPEDWNLLYILMPSFKNRALCYQARLIDPIRAVGFFHFQSTKAERVFLPSVFFGMAHHQPKRENHHSCSDIDINKSVHKNS